MPQYYIALFSILLYVSIIGIASKKRILLYFRQWPKNPTMFMIWTLWVIFLLVLAPLSYQEGDMGVWRTAIENLLHGELLPASYVYLPVYAELLSALAWPFHLMGWAPPLLIVYIVKWFVIFSYVGCAILMSKIVPNHSELAPLGIVMAPVTVFYIFFGTNHVVMFFFLLIALMLIKEKRWFGAGFFAAFSCYKFLLVPTFIVLSLIITQKYGFRCALRVLLGGMIFLVPSLVYYYYDPQTLLKVISHQAAIGAHSQQIEPFHFFFLIAYIFKGFEAWYIGKKVWFLLSMLGIPVSLLLYKLKRVNFLQCLALSYAFVTIFAPEPFRLEPLVGLLWLDAIFRESFRMQTAIFSTLFIQAAAWYDEANSKFLVFDPATPHSLWLGKGIYIGLAIIIMFRIVVSEKDKRDLILPDAHMSSPAA